jgi:hypothetical protein
MNNSDIILYQTEDGTTKIEVRLENETVWLSQTQISELFQKSRITITEHIGNIFKEGELDENSVSRKFRHTASESSMLLRNRTQKTQMNMINTDFNLIKS